LLAFHFLVHLLAHTMAHSLDTRWLLVKHLDIQGWPLRVMDADAIREHAGKKASDAPPSTGSNAAPVSKKAKTGAGQWLSDFITTTTLLLVLSL
jgi:hypothetical protein